MPPGPSTSLLPAALLALPLLALPLLALPLHAQSRYTVTPYAATDRALPGAPSVYGLAITSWAGVFGIRGSGALGDLRVERFADGTSRTRPGAWTADVDLVLSPTQARELRLLFGGLEPAGFVGLGTHGVRSADGTTLRTPTWSVGGSLTHRLAGALALETEARWRTPVSLEEGRPVPAELRDDWELRLGLAFRFGDAHRSSGSRTRAGGSWPAPRSGDRRTGDHRTGGTARHPAPRASASAARVLDTADDHLGARYVYGGTSPSGFDCSGYVQYVFRRHGVSLPRTSRQQASAGQPVAASVRSLRPGDLMFFATNGSRIDHVAIYAGGNRIIHSSSSGGGVRYDDLDSRRGRWFVDHMVAARRVLDASGRSLIQDYLESVPFTGELDPPDRGPGRD